MRKDSSTVNEARIKGSPDLITHSQIRNIYHQMNNCVCKIIKNEIRGTGFFCKVPFPNQNNLLPALITANHVLDISKYNKVEFYLNSKIYSILLDGSRKIYSNKHLDCTIIEIKKDVINTNYFLEIDENINQINLKNIYLEKPVYILRYEFGKKLAYSSGIITGIINTDYMYYYRITYSYSTEPGASGGPIINSSNFKVIGIHKGYKRDLKWNVGIFIKGPKSQNQNLYHI